MHRVKKKQPKNSYYSELLHNKVTAEKNDRDTTVVYLTKKTRFLLTATLSYNLKQSNATQHYEKQGDPKGSSKIKSQINPLTF